MSFGDVVKGIGMAVGGLVMIGAKDCIDRLNGHNEKVKEFKAKFERCNTSVEELKAIVKREVEKGNIFSAEAQAAIEILKAKGINLNDGQNGGKNA